MDHLTGGAAEGTNTNEEVRQEVKEGTVGVEGTAGVVEAVVGVGVHEGMVKAVMEVEDNATGCPFTMDPRCCV